MTAELGWGLLTHLLSFIIIYFSLGYLVKWQTSLAPLVGFGTYLFSILLGLAVFLINV